MDLTKKEELISKMTLGEKIFLERRIWILTTCKQCGVKRLVNADCLKRPSYTGLCARCSGKRVGTMVGNLPKSKIPIEIRFWEYVNKTDGCWLWTGHKTKGYGAISSSSDKYIAAHRFSWILHNGNIPKGLCVLHRCDNPSCVNPDHLFLGTLKDNTQDMVSKGRGHFHLGENHYYSKLKTEDIPFIKLLLENGKTLKVIAGIFNVSQGAIFCIKSGTTWKYIN